MNAPSLWQQLFIAVCALVAIPYVIALLKKLRLLPLLGFLLAVNIFPLWALSHKALCVGLLVATIAYPILVLGRQLLQLWQEERWLKYHLLATANHLNSEQDVLRPSNKYDL